MSETKFYEDNFNDHDLNNRDFNDHDLNSDNLNDNI